MVTHRGWEGSHPAPAGWLQAEPQGMEGRPGPGGRLRGHPLGASRPDAGWLSSKGPCRSGPLRGGAASSGGHTAPVPCGPQCCPSPRSPIYPPPGSQREPTSLPPTSRPRLPPPPPPQSQGLLAPPNSQAHWLLRPRPRTRPSGAAGPLPPAADPADAASPPAASCLPPRTGEDVAGAPSMFAAQMQTPEEAGGERGWERRRPAAPHASPGRR